MEKKGLVHIYTGNGKGKTTASVGLSLRALGQGKSVLFVQFLKSSETGEINFFNNIDNIDIIRNNKPYPFTYNMTKKQENEIFEINNLILENVKNNISNKNYDLLILDEIIGTYNYGYINKNYVLDFLLNRDKKIEMVLTGQDAPQEFIEIADYVSSIEKIKHPFDKGIKARKGIEY